MQGWIGIIKKGSLVTLVGGSRGLHRKALEALVGSSGDQCRRIWRLSWKALEAIMEDLLGSFRAPRGRLWRPSLGHG